MFYRTYGAPDGRLALAFLERARPEEWSTNRRSIDCSPHLPW